MTSIVDPYGDGNPREPLNLTFRGPVKKAIKELAARAGMKPSPWVEQQLLTSQLVRTTALKYAKTGGAAKD